MTGVLATALTSVSFAGNNLEDSSAAALVYDESAPQEIKVSELPQAVQEALETEVYIGWKAERAWIIKKEENTLYQVEVSNEEEATTLIFDENGVAKG